MVGSCVQQRDSGGAFEREILIEADVLNISVVIGIIDVVAGLLNKSPQAPTAPLLHVGRHGLQRLLQTSGKWPASLTIPPSWPPILRASRT